MDEPPDSFPAGKVNRARFLCLLGAGILAGKAQAAEKPAGSAILSVGVLTDCQYADADTPGSARRRSSG